MRTGRINRHDMGRDGAGAAQDGRAAGTGRPAISRATLTGCMIAAVFGMVWGQAAASGLPGSEQAVVRAVTLVLAITILAAIGRLRRVIPPGTESMFRTRSYLITVAAEVMALAAGAIVLAHTGQAKYVVAWIAAVVGVHFFVFGWFFGASYYALGAAILAGAVIGTVAGLTGHGRDAVLATTGLIASASLLLMAAVRVLPHAVEARGSRQLGPRA